MVSVGTEGGTPAGQGPEARALVPGEGRARGGGSVRTAGPEGSAASPPCALVSQRRQPGALRWCRPAGSCWP